MYINTLPAKVRISLALFLCILCLGVCKKSYAQDSSSEESSNTSLQKLEELISESIRLEPLSTQPISKGRFDTKANVTRALYRLDATMSQGLSGAPIQIARSFLAENVEQLGIDRSLDDLVLQDITTTDYSHHATFQQHYRGVPVYGRTVKVNMNKSGEVTMVLNSYHPGLALPLSEVSPSISGLQAIEEANAYLDLDVENTSSAELYVYPSASPRLVWRFVVWTAHPFLELEVLIDANNGQFVAVSHLSTHAHHVHKKELGENNKDLHGSVEIKKSDDHLHPEVIQRVAGTGLVFDPDPLTSSGQQYGFPFIDSNDGDVTEINEERRLVDLLDIAQGGDGLYRLVGPHVQIVGESAGGSIIYTPPSESSSDGFRYSRSNPFFEAVNVYYHIDKSQRYIQSLNVGRDIQNTSIPVNPHGLLQEDNSRYYFEQNFISFGLGGVDDAEDALVIWHEYGHAILNGSAEGLLADNEGKALHEGWADYWAGSYARSLVEENQSSRSDWPFLFKWDSGDGAIWGGREVAFSGTYPDDVFCDDGGFLCDIYEDGLFWANTLMEVYDELGRTQTDRLALASHIYLSSPVTFQDAAEAVVQADVDLNGGEHVDFLISLFNEKGLISLSNFGPIVLHEPLGATEQLGGTLPLVVEASGISSPIDRVFAVYTHPGSIADTLFLELVNNNTYTAQFPLPDVSGEVTYFIGVEDQLGLFVRDPAGISLPVYRFMVGPDVEPPSIIHEQLDSISIIDWPAQIEVEVEDNFGVDTVDVDFYIDNPFGIRIAEGQFGLVDSGGGVYRGAFPTSMDNLLPGSTVFYRVAALDIAQNGNLSYLPESGYLGFNIILENGLYRSYDFERVLPDFSVEGLWELGAPAFGLRGARSGSSLWGTVNSGAYPGEAQRSILELPSLNLAGLEQAYLVFWHWYDTEHGGSAQPDGTDNTVLWDGGNVKVSTDEGITWSIVTPEGGYNGTIASARDNPLQGEPAFGGFSYGWRKVVVPIPVGGIIEIRFEFGTDSGSGGAQVQHAGWFIDDVSVVTELTSDTVMPRIGGAVLPESVQALMAGEPLPVPSIDVFDDTGVESVFVEYELTNSGNIKEQSRFRLSMDTVRFDVFSGAFPFPESSIQVGDILRYAFRVKDFSGNTIVFPDSPENNFLVEFRLVGQQDLLLSAVPSGLWENENDKLVLRRREEHNPISSLVFGPIELPLNADDIVLDIQSTYDIIGNHGGNIKIAEGAAKQWAVIEPTQGYTGVLPDNETVPESMRAQRVFTGERLNTQEATFLVDAYAGKQIWIRADFGAMSELASDEKWEIESVSIQYSTLEPVNGGFSVPRTFKLYENFPDPFSIATTISYTLESNSPVRLEVYNMLGQRMAILVNDEQVAGTYSLTFNGDRLASGIYLLRLETNQGQQIEKMVLAK